MSKPRVLLADDHAMVLTAFHRLLEGECEVVGQVSDGGALVTSVPDIQPDVIVLDISMPVLNGLEAARRISGQFPHIRIVFLTMHEDRDLMLEAFKAGASGYLLKRSAASELILAIRQVVQQRSYVTPLLGMNVIRSLQEGPRKLKSLVMCTYLGAVALGNVFTAAVNFLIQNPDGTVKLRGASYFFFFVIVMVVTAMLFVYFARFYKGRTYIQEEEEGAERGVARQGA